MRQHQANIWIIGILKVEQSNKWVRKFIGRNNDYKLPYLGERNRHLDLGNPIVEGVCNFLGSVSPQQRFECWNGRLVL